VFGLFVKLIFFKIFRVDGPVLVVLIVDKDVIEAGAACS